MEKPPGSKVRFSDFDSRGYPTVDVTTGYGEWVATYEDTVEDAMDIALLEELSEVPWRTSRLAADLGCGTGRTGAWLRAKGVASISLQPCSRRARGDRDARSSPERARDGRLAGGMDPDGDEGTSDRRVVAGIETEVGAISASAHQRCLHLAPANERRRRLKAQGCPIEATIRHIRKRVCSMLWVWHVTGSLPNDPRERAARGCARSPEMTHRPGEDTAPRCRSARRDATAPHASPQRVA
jgi:hypothetical protein